MPLAISLIVLGVLIVVMWVAFARDPGPSPADVAIAYEHAWEQLDFDLLYDLSGNEMRDGLGRKDFVSAKRTAHVGAPTAAASDVVVEEAVSSGQTALVVTRVSTDTGSVRNNVVLEKRAGGWTVVRYGLRSE
jgi:hypothetical protein